MSPRARSEIEVTLHGVAPPVGGWHGFHAVQPALYCPAQMRPACCSPLNHSQRWREDGQQISGAGGERPQRGSPPVPVPVPPAV